MFDVIFVFFLIFNLILSISFFLFVITFFFFCSSESCFLFLVLFWSLQFLMGFNFGAKQLKLGYEILSYFGSVYQVIIRSVGNL